VFTPQPHALLFSQIARECALPAAAAMYRVFLVFVGMVPTLTGTFLLDVVPSPI
jgi:hypothetical protein